MQKVKHMCELCIGQTVHYTPHAVIRESAGPEKTPPKPRDVRGKIIAINRSHRHFTVRAIINGYAINETFKF